MSINEALLFEQITDHLSLTECFLHFHKQEKVTTSRISLDFHLGGDDFA